MSSPDRTVVQARHALPLHLTVQRPHIPWRQALWEKKLRELGVDEETIQRRLKRAEAEIANSVNYDEHVVNIEVDSCAESIYSIIQFKLQHGSDE